MEAKKVAEPKQPLRRLGRGLSSLMALDTPVRVEVPQVQQTPVVAKETPPITPLVVPSNVLSDFKSVGVDTISPSRFQPRKVMDEGAIARLAQSIKRSGLMQPVVVRPSGGGKFELIAGERRWRAAKAAGLLKIPALVREVGDEQAAEWALVENVQREDLNPMERAWGLKSLAEKFRLTQDQLAERVGMERSTVANLVRLTELEKEIAQLISAGRLSMGHGKVLLGVPPGPVRLALAVLAADEEMTVRQLELRAKMQEKAPGSPRPLDPEMEARFAGQRDLERQIGEQMGTKVVISTEANGKRGKITFEFYGIDHFGGLLARMGVRMR